jgi:hypothetical protein
MASRRKMRWLLRALATALTVGVTVVALLGLSRPQDPLKERLAQVKLGMTQAEVEQIMGRRRREWPDRGDGLASLTWGEEEAGASVVITFERGRVFQCKSLPENPSLWERICRWLRL